MKFLKTISIGMCFIGLPLFAQVPSGHTVDFNWGPIHEVDGQQTIADVDSQFVYTFAVNNGAGWDREKWFFTKYHIDDMSPVWQIETEPLEWRRSELGFEQVKIINGDYYIFYNAFDSDRDRMTLLAQKITGDGEMGDLYPLEDYPTDDTKDGGFHIRWSGDNDRFAVIAVPQFVGNERAQYEAKLYDLEFTELWEHRERMRTHNENFQVADYVLGRDDKIYVLAYEMPNLERGGRDREGKSNQTYSLYRISPDSEKIEVLNLELDDYFVTGPWLVEDDVNMHVGGIYSTTDFTEEEGSFILTINNEEFTVQNRIENEIPEAIFDRLADRGLADLFEDFGRPFKVAHVVRKESGGAILVLQVQYEEVDYQVTGTVMGIPVSWRRIVTYHYEDYLIQSLDADGKQEWISHIPLDQAFVESNLFMGDLFITNGDKIHMIFNDDKDNIEEWSDEDPNIDTYSEYSLRRGMIIMVTVEQDGTISYEQLAKTKDQEKDMYFVPRACRPMGENTNEAAIFSFYGEDVRVGRLTID